MTDINRSSLISILVDIGRGVFQNYFTPTAYRRFDRDHKIDDILALEFSGRWDVIALFEKTAPKLREEITKHNALLALKWKEKIDFETYIKQALWEESSAWEVFKTLLDRMENFEQEEKQRVFEKMQQEQQLDDDDYRFLLELIIYKRCESLQEFTDVYKFIRNTQFNEVLIIANLSRITDTLHKQWFVNLINEKWSAEAKKVLSDFL